MATTTAAPTIAAAAAAAAGNSSSEQLAELEARLRAPDAVMEPQVLELLKEYLRAGGRPAAAIEELSEGYAGYAQMANVLCQWLEIADVQLLPASGGGGGGSGALLLGGGGGGGGGADVAGGGLAGAAADLTAAAAAAAGAAGAGGDATADGGAAAAAAGGGGGGMDAGGAAADAPRAAGVPDEFALLAELARERFEPGRFLSVFKSGAPAWLRGLIGDRRGRHLVYQLSAAHRSSLLLSYAIQRIIQDGHEHEVAVVGASLASYFEAFHRLLCGRLGAFARAAQPQQLRALALEVAESCAASQHTYAHAQLLIAAAARWPNGGAFRWLGQQVEAAAVARHGAARAYQLRPLLFVPRGAGGTERAAAQLAAEVLMRSAPPMPGAVVGPGAGAGAGAGAGGAAAAAGDSGGGDQAAVVAQLHQVEHLLRRLHALYYHADSSSNDEDADGSSASAEQLRHPALMQLLLTGMFAVATDPAAAAAAAATTTTGGGTGGGRGGGSGGGGGGGGGGTAGLDLLELCIQLLARAVAGDAAAAPAAAEGGGSSAHEAALAAAIAGEPPPPPSPPAPAVATDDGARGVSPAAAAAQAPRRGAAGVAALLRRALQLARRVPSAKLSEAELDAASEVCRQPVAALGLLQHARRLLLQDDVAALPDEKLALLLPNLLSVLHRVACEQPGLVPQVLAVLRGVLTALGGARQDLSRRALSFLVSLQVSGGGAAAMDAAAGWAATADPSLVRHYLQLVLESVAPPYSQGFARAMLAIMRRSLIVRMRGSHAGMLAEFAAGCAAVVFLPPLSRQDQDLLDELGK